MTDSLRTRIAAVLTEAYPGKLASVAEFAADAVIRELGLQRLEAGKWALEPENGGRALRCPMWMLTDPTEADKAVAPVTYFVLGELVRVTAGKFAGLWVVIADKGGDKVNLAKLGGDDDRYLRMARRALVKVDPSEVLK